jgi:cytosine/adenosine deaminase-related metal-dependent hydrolase
VSARVVSAPWVLLGPVPLRDPTPGVDGADPSGAARNRGATTQALRDGAIALDGDHVVAVGPRAEIEARHGAAEHLDAVLLPALVNAHTHLELYHLRGRIQGGEGLAPWVQLLISVRAGAPRPERALVDAILDLEEAGVAAVGEVTNSLAALRHLGRAGVAGTVYHEVMGFTEPRIEAAVRAAAEQRATAGSPAPGLVIAPSPHAVYSTHPRVMAELLRAGPASIHLAEDPAERQFCATMTGPLASLVRALGASNLTPLGRSAVAVAAPHLGPRSLVVHAVDLDDQDFADLARSGATVVLCPRSNLHIGGRLPDFPRLLASGVPLAIGTDSLASSPSLHPLAELVVLARQYPIPPRRLLPLAWNGAAVGAPTVGRLAPGTAPGIVAAPLAGLRPEDPAAFLLGAFAAEERHLTWVTRHRPEVLAA